VLSHRLLSYWAYQLERYRRSAASMFFNGLAYLWLIVRMVLGLALINEAIFTEVGQRLILNAAYVSRVHDVCDRRPLWRRN
jgi:hypothetical protein